MKKIIFIFVIIIISSVTIYSCNPSEKNKSIYEKNKITSNKSTLFDKLLLSSNFYIDDQINKETIHTELDNIDNGIYTYRVYVDNTGGTGTLGWVKYDSKCNILYDVTGDIGILPKQLKIDKNIAYSFNKSIDNIVGECPIENITELPFNLDTYLLWQDSIDMSMALSDEQRYSLYPINNNFRLNYYYNFQNDSDVIAYNYFKLESGSNYNCYIVEVGNRGISTQYQLITIDDNHVISQNIIGELKNNSRSIFTINKDREISILEQKIKYDKSSNRNISILNTDSTLLFIDENGLLKK